MTQPTIVGIAGASGSGKSHFAQQLLTDLSVAGLENQVAIIPQDAYYRDQSHLTFEQRERINFDHPDAFEYELLVSHLQQFLDGQTVDVPQYDYSQHNRKQTSIQIGPCPVLILEGILLFHDQRVRELIDIKIFVDMDLETCLQRRIKRDQADRKRSEASVRQQFETTVLPMHNQFVLPSRSFSDLMVAGQGSNEVVRKILTGHMIRLVS